MAPHPCFFTGEKKTSFTPEQRNSLLSANRVTYLTCLIPVQLPWKVTLAPSQYRPLLSLAVELGLMIGRSVWRLSSHCSSICLQKIKLNLTLKTSKKFTLLGQVTHYHRVKRLKVHHFPYMVIIICP